MIRRQTALTTRERVPPIHRGCADNKVVGRNQIGTSDEFSRMNDRKPCDYRFARPRPQQCPDAADCDSCAIVKFFSYGAHQKSLVFDPHTAEYPHPTPVINF
jgi:hypothetical protein